MKRYSLFAVVLLLALCACSGEEQAPDIGPDAPPDDVPDLTGSYVVGGFDPLGTEYGGYLTITAGEAPGEYDLQWIITGSIQEGVGTLAGNTLQVEWHNVEGVTGKAQGTATYTVTVKGVLHGTRTVEGHTGAGTETAFPNE